MNGEDGIIICPYCKHDFGNINDEFGFEWEDEDTGKELKMETISDCDYLCSVTCFKCDKTFEMSNNSVTSVHIFEGR